MWVLIPSKRVPPPSFEKGEGVSNLAFQHGAYACDLQTFNMNMIHMQIKKSMPS